MNEEEKVFINRRDAGVRLGKLLEKDYKNTDTLVLGIPRGGVEIAYHIARIINGELSVIVTKKLPYPFQEELAFGAASEDGSYYLTSRGKGMDKITVEGIIKQQLAEIENRIDKYRGGQPLPLMSGRIVMVVDDGIATGSTLIPALKLCRSKEAKKVVVAAPVAGRHYVPEIDRLADDVRILTQPEDFFAVGQVYEDFRGLEDDDVIALLSDFKHYMSSKREIYH